MLVRVVRWAFVLFWSTAITLGAPDNVEAKQLPVPQIEDFRPTNHLNPETAFGEFQKVFNNLELCFQESSQVCSSAFADFLFYYPMLKEEEKLSILGEIRKGLKTLESDFPQ